MKSIKALFMAAAAVAALLQQCSFAPVSGVPDGGGTSIEVVGVRGVVVDKSMQPAAGAELVLFRGGSEENGSVVRGQATAREDGWFFIPEAGIGRYFLEARDGLGNGAARSFAIDVGADGKNVDTLKLRETGSVCVAMLQNISYNGLVWPYMVLNKNGFYLNTPCTTDTVQSDGTPLLKFFQYQVPPDTYTVVVGATLYNASSKEKSTAKYDLRVLDTVIIVGEGEKVCLPDLRLVAERTAAMDSAFRTDSLAYVSLCRKCGVEATFEPGKVSMITWRMQELNVTATTDVSFDDIAEELDQLDQLKNLILRNVKGESLPDAVCRMRKLSTIYIADGALTSIPREIAGLPLLSCIYFENQRLGALPAFVDDLPAGRVRSLSLEGNPIVIATPEDQQRVNSIWSRVGWFSLAPICMNDFATVRRLFSENGYGSVNIDEYAGVTPGGRIIGIYLPPDLPLHLVPQDLAGLDSLRMFTAGRNTLSSVPQWFSRCRALNRLELPNGKLTTLPVFLADMPVLHFLNVANNRLAEVPGWIANLENEPLVFLADFSSNRIPPNKIGYSKPVCLVEPQLPSTTGEPDDVVLSRDLAIAERLFKAHQPNQAYSGLPFSAYGTYIRIQNDRVNSIGLSLIKYGYGDAGAGNDAIGELFRDLARLDSLKTVYFEVGGELDDSSFHSLLASVTARLPHVIDLELYSLGGGFTEFPEGFLEIMPNVKRIGLYHHNFSRIPETLRNRPGLESVDLFFNPLIIESDKDRAWMNTYCKISPFEYASPLASMWYEPDMTWEKSVEYEKLR
jgi:Leucine-rich repeat (LRR) protein